MHYCEYVSLRYITVRNTYILYTAFVHSAYSTLDLANGQKEKQQQRPQHNFNFTV
jgi:hypothetical protein